LEERPFGNACGDDDDDDDDDDDPEGEHKPSKDHKARVEKTAFNFLLLVVLCYCLLLSSDLAGVGERIGGVRVDRKHHRTDGADPDPACRVNHHVASRIESFDPDNGVGGGELVEAQHVVGESESQLVGCA
jgi:hypothetical protein